VHPFARGVTGNDERRGHKSPKYLQEVMPMEHTIKWANSIAGKLGNASKMPGKTYGLPAKECGTGSKLRNVKGSVCYGCYALKGRYVMDNVQTAEYKRLASLTNPLWTDAMVTLIAKQCAAIPFFRWHDSGDIQDLEHLGKIVEVAQRTPQVNHWLPTREYKLVKFWRDAYGEFPANLTVRLSAHMVDSDAPTGYGLPTSTVVSDSTETCPSRNQDNECGDCRACWDSDTANVSYAVH
jgi:hypothetical protein